MIIVETTSGLAGNLVTCLFACTSAGLMKIFWIIKGGFAGIFESSDTRYPLLSRCSSCFTKKSEFVLSFLLILIVPCLSTCVIYTSSSNLVAQRASSLSSKQGTRSLLSSATWTNHRATKQQRCNHSTLQQLQTHANSYCKRALIEGPAGYGCIRLL